MKKPIPKEIERKITKYEEYMKKAGELDKDLRHWLYKNNYEGTIINGLIDTGLSGDATAFIAFLNGEPDEYGSTIEDFQHDNSKTDEFDYGL
jgi:hypothetical protein